MEFPNSEEVLQFLSSCLTQIKWRLKTTSKRRLEMATGLSGCVSIRPRSHRRSNLQFIYQIPPHIQSSSIQEWHHGGLSLRRANKLRTNCDFAANTSLKLTNCDACSFSVPYDLSTEGSKEVWAEAFRERMSLRWEECKYIWRSLDLQISECYPQAIDL